MSTYDRKRLVYDVKPFADLAVPAFEQTVVSFLGEAPIQVALMGSLRRAIHGEAVEIGDLDLMVTCPAEDAVHSFLDLDLPKWLTVTEKKAHGWLSLPDAPAERMMIDAWWCPWSSVGPFSLFLTGPAEWNVWMRQVTNRASGGRLMLTQYGLFEAVVKPTKTYPDRRVPGARVDTPTGDTAADREYAFWTQWADEVGVDVDLWGGYPSPHERRPRR